MSRITSNPSSSQYSYPSERSRPSSGPDSSGDSQSAPPSHSQHSSSGPDQGSPQPEQRQQDSGHGISGGVDSRTQFWATQNMRDKTSGPKAEVKADGNIPDSQDENGKTAAQENTTGPAAKVTSDEINKAAGGNKDIANLLTKLDSDVEGHKELRLALDKGTTYKMGSLPGNVVGLTTTGSNAPVVTLDSDNNAGLNIDTVAHETAHAAYQDMSHAEVYRLGHRVEQRVNSGQTRDTSHDPASTPQTPGSDGSSGGAGGSNGSGDAGNTGGSNGSGDAGNAGGSSGGDGSSSGAGGSSGGGSPGGADGSSGGGSPNGAGGSSGGGSPNGAGGSSGGGGGGGATNNTGTNTTIAALPAAGNITDAQLSEIANGDPKVIAALKLMLKDPDGAKLVQMVIKKHGKIVDDESLSGGAVGLAPVGGDNPTIKIKESALNSTGDIAQTLFHEFTHVSGDPGDAHHDSGNDGHDSVYNAQKAFCERMGIRFSG